jgi:hypothetical protein
VAGGAAGVCQAFTTDNSYLPRSSPRLRPAARLDRAAVVVVMSAVLFFLLGATIFSMGESKQAAVFFLVLALVAAAGVIYLRWRGQG